MTITIVAVPVVADRVAAVVVERMVASRLQCAAGLAVRPDVDIAGFPLLTQVAGRRFGEVRVRAGDVVAGKAALRNVSVDVRDLNLAADRLSAGQVAADATVIDVQAAK